ncbi:hypothetical protein [Methylobacterium sp. WL8]|uniref:hypothetical protein n=1 Tax=Methylobacterium sp. WL8 TaxID=2603899 RepID=UPI00164EF7C2|nr:hypothetical protein [Methylobacterium sp. WL8]
MHPPGRVVAVVHHLPYHPYADTRRHPTLPPPTWTTAAATTPWRTGTSITDCA